MKGANMFKFLEKLLERLGPIAPMPIVAPPLLPYAIVEPPAAPVEEKAEVKEEVTVKPKRSARNQTKPSARKKLKKAE